MQAEHADAAEVALQSTLFGVGGWALENVVYGPRFSAMFGGARVPFLPIYAVGGSAILLAKPHLAKLPWVVRVPIYAAFLSALEFAGCQVDRRIFGACSWDYENNNCANPNAGCIDVNHGLLWGALGVAVEGITWIAEWLARRHEERSTVTGRDRSMRVRNTRADRRRARQTPLDRERRLQLRGVRVRPARVRHALDDAQRLDLRRRTRRPHRRRDALPVLP